MSGGRRLPVRRELAEDREPPLAGLPAHAHEPPGVGKPAQSTPHRVREKPRHAASDRRVGAPRLNTEPPVPVTSPRYSLLHARSSTLRRYSALLDERSAQPLRVALNHVQIRTLANERVSPPLALQLLAVHQLQSVRGGL